MMKNEIITLNFTLFGLHSLMKPSESKNCDSYSWQDGEWFDRFIDRAEQK